MKKAKFFLGLALTAAILCRAETAVAAAQRAMHMWATTVAPALFPFLALMPLLTGAEACAVYEWVFAPVMRPLFHLPGSAAPAMIIGMISGSPGGAAALARIASGTGMKKSELRRLAPVVCGVGPAYLVMGVGLGLYGSMRVGAGLVCIQLAAQLILLLAMRFAPDVDDAPVRAAEIAQRDGIRGAVEGVLCVCGYMVIFGVAGCVIGDFAGESAGVLLRLAADLPSGMAVLAEKSFYGREIVLGMAVGFGGLCIAAQNMDVLGPLGVDWRDFLRVKFVQSALCGGLAALFLKEKTRTAAAVSAGGRTAYAFSMLCALILCMPALISLSKNLFLNKRKVGEIPVE